MRESDVELYLKIKVKALGGETRKVRWGGRAHAPDRRVMLPGNCFWVEVKAPGEKPRPGQVREHKRMRRLGERVEIVDSYESVDAVVRV